MASTLLNSEDYLRILLLVLPLVVGGILHMVVVKADILSYLKKPIHQRWFGMNKTWRGFVVMPLATWPGVWLAQEVEKLSDLSTPLLLNHSSFFLAFILAIAYCLAELPNSFIKRRLGIKEGQTSDRWKVFFIVMDQFDSASGCLIAYKLTLGISWPLFWITIAFGMLIHFIINLILYSFKLRKNPF